LAQPTSGTQRLTCIETAPPLASGSFVPAPGAGDTQDRESRSHEME
jgi:hypothetical protein